MMFGYLLVDNNLMITQLIEQSLNQFEMIRYIERIEVLNDCILKTCTRIIIFLDIVNKQLKKYL